MMNAPRQIISRAALTGTTALVLLVATLLFPLIAAANQSNNGTLVVSGRAEVRATPDMARFSVGVETRAETVDEAGRLNAEAMERVRMALYNAGAAPEALKTTNFNVYPEWHYNRDDGTRTLIGYRVSHSLEVTVTDLDRLGAMLDAAMSDGANQVSGPTFGLINPEELEAQALAEAVRRARAKAEVLARASGVYLKGISHISEHVALPPSMPIAASYAMFDVAERAATEISAGEVTVTANVSITFQI